MNPDPTRLLPPDSPLPTLLGERGRRVLGAVLYSLLVALPLLLGASLLDQAPLLEQGVIAGMFVWTALLAWLHRRGRDPAALGGLVVMMLAAGGVLGASYGSVRAVSTLAFVGAIVCGGIFLDRRALGATLAASVAIIGALIVAQDQGWLRAPDYAVGFSQWIEYSVSLAVIALCIGLARSLALEAMRRALDSEARFRKLFDESPVAAAIFTPGEMRFVDCNAAYVALFGRAREQVVGRRCHDLGVWRDAAALGSALEVLARDGAVRDRQVELVRADGSVLDAQFSWTLIDIAGQQRCILAQIIDVSEQRRAEQVLRGLNEELERRVRERTRELSASNTALAAARDAAEAATRAKSQFLANVSHEIRTPMNAVIGFTDLALRRVQSDGGALAEYLRNARRAAGSLLELINQVLDFSKIEAQRLVVDHEAFDLDELIARLRSVLGVPAAERGLGLTVSVDRAVSRRRIGDRLRIEQVLLNLGGNALKFTERGQVAIEVGAGAAPQQVRFTVRDSGIGIDPGWLPRLFHPFDQLDASTTRRYGGTGLGLAISSQLVELMGGRIEVASTPGEGSVFWFELPLPPAAATVATAPSPAPADAAARLHGRRVLLVEDNELNQLVARETLERGAGVEVTVAGDGAQALAALEREPFDLVLMDVQMPGIDGYETAARIRLDPRHVRLPIVAMTAHAQPSDRERSLSAGMNGHVTKPFDPDHLFETLASLLDPAPARDDPHDPGAARAGSALAVTPLP